jgi:hypothetical protein
MIRQKEDLLARYTPASGQKTLCKAGRPSEECGPLIRESILKSFKSANPATEHQGMSVLKLQEMIKGFRVDSVFDFRCSYGCRAYCSRSSISSDGRCRCGGKVYIEGSHSKTCDPMPELLRLIEQTISSVPGIDLGALGHIPVRGSKWDVMNDW